MNSGLNNRWFGRRAAALAVVLVASFVSTGCFDSFSGDGPPTPISERARTRWLLTKHFRLAVFDFGTAKDAATNDAARAVPAQLLTALRKDGRFSLYDGGNLRVDRAGHEALAEATAEGGVDGYLTGTITSVSGSEACFEVRLANATNHEVLYARSSCAKIVGKASDQVDRIAAELSRAIKRIGYATVTSVDGKLIFLDKGVESGVLAGMVAYLVSSGDSVKDRATHQWVREYTGVDQAASVFGRTEVVVGNLVIIEAGPKFSVAKLSLGDYALPGDVAQFK